MHECLNAKMHEWVRERLKCFVCKCYNYGDIKYRNILIGNEQF